MIDTASAELAEYLESSVNVWIWNGYHKRGAISHFLRARQLATAADDTGWAETWAAIGVNQTMSLLSTTSFLEISREARSQMEVANSIPDDQRAELLPMGALSPLGTTAGLDALLHVAELSHTGSHFKHVTFPFLVATCYEFLTLMMSYVILLAPLVIMLRQILSGAEMSASSVTMLLAVTAISLAISSQFKKMFRLLV